MESGVCGTAHVNGDSNLHDFAQFAIYGTEGVLRLPDPNTFGGDVCLYPADSDWQSAPMETLPCAFDFSDNSRGLGPADMARAIRQRRPARAGAEMACHVLETLDAMLTSGAEGRFVEIHSRCERPEALV